jgi:hypothetical protein
MTARELADEVNGRGLYAKRDGSVVEANQIHARTNNGALFEKDGASIPLKESPHLSTYRTASQCSAMTTRRCCRECCRTERGTASASSGSRTSSAIARTRQRRSSSTRKGCDQRGPGSTARDDLVCARCARRRFESYTLGPMSQYQCGFETVRRGFGHLVSARARF